MSFFWRLYILLSIIILIYLIYRAGAHDRFWVWVRRCSAGIFLLVGLFELGVYYKSDPFPGLIKLGCDIFPFLCYRQPPIPEIPTSHPPAPEDKRPITYYSAKSALARLVLYLREKGDPSVKGIWHASPASSALYQRGSSLSRSVGGWVFEYVDTQGKTRFAMLNCWGEVSVKDDSAINSKLFPRAVNIDEIVLDNTDANTVVLNYGGEAKSDGLGGWLMAVEVEGRGVRPLWAGNEWFMRKEEIIVMVDTQTGELYRPISEKKMQPLAAGQKQPKAEWDGGFDETSPDAITERSEHYYWWPRVYQDRERRYVYNRILLHQKLKEETEKPIRDALSWLTSGILHNVLGEWVEGVDDLSHAVKMEPQNNDFRYYRSLTYLIIRDLDKAKSDLEMLPQSYKRRSDGLGYVAMFSGQKDSGGLLAMMDNIQTDAGMVPLVTQVGPVPLTSWLSR